MSDQPHWERGQRVHGYWIGMDRLGWVGLPPGRGACKQYGYFWEFMTADKLVNGRTATLRAAKRQVVRAYRNFLKTGQVRVNHSPKTVNGKRLGG